MNDRLAAFALAAALAGLTPGPAPAAESLRLADAASSAPGDIPDTQLFVTYRSKGGYSVLAPEGWTRSVRGADVTFESNFNGERVALGREARDARALVRNLRSVFKDVRDPRTAPRVLPAGRTTLVTFTSESAPDAVTGRRVRLENVSYFFARAGKTVRLDLWAPRGADNADQWNKISRSLRWR